VSDDQHIPVMLTETVDALVLRTDGVYVDCTFGRGGHSREVLSRLGAAGRLIAMDRDPQAVQAMLAIDDPRFTGVYAPFSTLEESLQALGISRVDGVMMDVGISSPQIDQAHRGFSFRLDGPLDMRMDTQSGESAADFIARADARAIAEVIKNYGEERFAVQIAAAIVARRQERPISTTRELAAIVAGAVRSREPGQDPATRTFQALRIHVNQELAQLEQGVAQAIRLLSVGGRLAVICFHSLEDRIVKRAIDALASPNAGMDPKLRYLPLPVAKPKLKKVARLKCSDEEIARNPRARSAILRVAEKLPEAS
jgi:16S rRNA (cytosine1402-N4)-methyltransferase